MSAKLMGQVYSIELGHAEQDVLLAMADHAQDDGSNVFPSVDRIAWKTGYDRRSVQRAMKALREGCVLVETAAATRTLPTEYRIDLGAGTLKPLFEPGTRHKAELARRAKREEELGNGDTMPPGASEDRPASEAIRGGAVSRQGRRGAALTIREPSVNNDAVEDAEHVGTQKDVEASNHSPLPSKKEEPQTPKDFQEIANHHAATFSRPLVPLGEEEKKRLGEVLAVASLEEAKRAISGVKAAGWKSTSLCSIFKPRREWDEFTMRDRVDTLLSKAAEGEEAATPKLSGLERQEAEARAMATAQGTAS